MGTLLGPSDLPMFSVFIISSISSEAFSLKKKVFQTDFSNNLCRFYLLKLFQTLFFEIAEKILFNESLTIGSASSISFIFRELMFFFVRFLIFIMAFIPSHTLTCYVCVPGNIFGNSKFLKF